MLEETNPHHYFVATQVNNKMKVGKYFWKPVLGALINPWFPKSSNDMENVNENHNAAICIFYPQFNIENVENA